MARIALSLLLAAAAAHADATVKDDAAKKLVTAMVNAGLELKPDARRERADVTVEKLQCATRGESAGDDSQDPYFGLLRYECRQDKKPLGEAGLLWQALSAVTSPDCKMGGRCSLSVRALTCSVHLKSAQGRFECTAK